MGSLFEQRRERIIRRLLCAGGVMHPNSVGMHPLDMALDPGEKLQLVEVIGAALREAIRNRREQEACDMLDARRDVVRSFVQLYEEGTSDNPFCKVRPLHDACRYGLVRVVQRLVQVLDPQELRYVTRGGAFQPLHYACWGGHLEIAQILAEREVPLFWGAEQIGKDTQLCVIKPINLAAAWGHTDVVRWLLGQAHERQNSKDLTLTVIITVPVTLNFRSTTNPNIP